jgi:hypothetical protein
LRETIFERVGKMTNVTSVSHVSHIAPCKRIRVAWCRRLVGVARTLAQRHDTDDRRDEAREADAP